MVFIVIFLPNEILDVNNSTTAIVEAEPVPEQPKPVTSHRGAKDETSALGCFLHPS